MQEKISLQGEEYLFAQDYEDNAVLREQMGRLCRKIWGFDFEKMYKNGFWEESFHPYTLFCGDKAVSHVSVSEMDIYLNQKVLHLVQLGTVMTDKDFRGRGLNRFIMERILADFDSKDGIFLYANETVYEYYPKFGFEKAYEYPRKVSGQFLKYLCERAGGVMRARKISAPAAADEERLLLSLSENCRNDCSFYPVNHRFMIGFYLNSFDLFSISDLLYRLPDGNTIVVAEVSKDSVTIHDILTEHGCDPEEVVVALITTDTKQVNLRLAYEAPFLEAEEERDAQDSRLFVRGRAAELLKQQKIIFPLTIHT